MIQAQPKYAFRIPQTSVGISVYILLWLAGLMMK